MIIDVHAHLGLDQVFDGDISVPSARSHSMIVIRPMSAPLTPKKASLSSDIISLVVHDKETLRGKITFLSESSVTLCLCG